MSEPKLTPKETGWMYLLCHAVRFSEPHPDLCSTEKRRAAFLQYEAWFSRGMATYSIPPNMQLFKPDALHAHLFSSTLDGFTLNTSMESQGLSRSTKLQSKSNEPNKPDEKEQNKFPTKTIKDSTKLEVLRELFRQYHVQMDNSCDETNGELNPFHEHDQHCLPSPYAFGFAYVRLLEIATDMCDGANILDGLK